MEPRIVHAIEHRRRLRLTYNGKPRFLEPQCYGVGTKGAELLRVCQLRGGTEREPLFDVARISEIVVIDDTFQAPGPQYKHGDSAVREIYCQQ